jgi:pyridinium-3,5-biscarboxylic acid mononucleotide sulfurtransferase
MTQGAELAAARLTSIISGSKDVAVACSGGIDSLVLSAAVQAAAKQGVTACTIFHAVSAAVPAQATERVVQCARNFDWNLRLIDAHEFDDSNYLRNPTERCFYCKSSLYCTIAGITSAQIFSGANLDDLDDYRPGLDAARNYRVCHPFIVAGIDKKIIRELASLYGLEKYRHLPASPCLSSRVETGISIDRQELLSIDRIEQLIAVRCHTDTVRCRLRARTVVIELEESQVDGFVRELDSNESLLAEIRSLLAGRFTSYPITCSPYKRGNATLKVKP